MSELASFVLFVSRLLEPVFHASSTAAAIVAVTALVRLVLHPLVRAAARGERARTVLAPRVGEVQRRYGKDPERMRRELQKVYAEAGASPAAGCLPTLLQLPVFLVLHHLFTTQGGLLSEELLGAPLGGRWVGALEAGGLFGGQGLVYLGLFALVAAVAGWTYARSRRAVRTARGPVPPALRWLPLLSFGTLLTAAYVPLAAGLYLATSTTWAAVERALLQRSTDPAPGPTPRPTP